MILFVTDEKERGEGGKGEDLKKEVLKTKHLQRVGASTCLFEMAGS